MKNHILFLFFLNSAVLFSQWQPDTRLTYDSSSSIMHANYKRIGVSGDTIHITWIDSRESTYDVYYKRSTNGGVNWSSDIRVTYNLNADRPGISVSNTNIYVAWSHTVSGVPHIYYSKSSNAGLNWSPAVQLVSSRSDFVYIASSGSYVYAVWVDRRNSFEELYFKRSTNNGDAWESDVRLTYSNGNAYEPCISSLDQFVHFAWYEYRSTNTGIYYKRSTNYGENWSSEILAGSASNSSVLPSLSASGGIVHLAWVLYRNFFNNVYYNRSTDRGVTWGSEIKLSNDSVGVRFAFIKASGEMVHVVWDNHINFRNIYYKRSTNSGLSWEPDTRLTNSISFSASPNVDVTYSAVHVIWNDDRDGNPEIYYKRNPTGNVVDVERNEGRVPDKFVVYQNYPNPFNPETNIKFDMPKSGFVNIKVYDLLGLEISQLVNKQLEAGTYNLVWDASNYPCGVYFYKMVVDNYYETKKMILLK